MATIDLTQEDFRILQGAEDHSATGVSISANHGSARQYRRLAEAGLLEHQAASMDTEWFGITDQGRHTLTQAKWV
jgi:hypothetical protein